MSWIRELFGHPHPAGLLIVAANTTVVYAFLVAGLRLLGKRELGQMNIYDLVLLIVIANSVQNAMVGDDTPLPGGLVSATTLLILNRLFSLLLSRSRKLSHLLVGEPRLLVNNGHPLKDRMDQEGITHEQLMAALREHGLVCLDQVRMAVLEVDGTISVVPE